jgi:glutamate-1-semialdehyde 2,1-aminomutase
MPDCPGAREGSWSDYDLHLALMDAKQRYAYANSTSQKAHSVAARHLPGGNTRTVLYFDPFPLYFANAEGSKLTDLDGHMYDDFLAEYTAGIFGHSDPRILATLQDTGQAGLNFGGHTAHEGKFASLLVERFPALELIRFTNSGTEANLMALGAARIFTGRDKIMAFSGAYHGAMLAFNNQSNCNAPFDFVIARYNNVDDVRFLSHSCGSELAAVIVEPMLQSGGCIPAEPGFLRELREQTASCGALLIFDEVVTSRLHPAGLHGKLGIKPDLITLGKYVGGGMSFGAFGGRREIMERFDPGSPGFIPHAGTFNNNTLTMAVGYTAMAEIYTAEAAVALNERGEKLRNSLNEMAVAAQASMQFTGLGSIMCVHMTKAEIKSAADAQAGNLVLRELFYFHLLSLGLYVAKRGMISLSLAITEEQIARLIEGVSAFIRKYRPLLVPNMH